MSVRIVTDYITPAGGRFRRPKLPTMCRTAAGHLRTGITADNWTAEAGFTIESIELTIDDRTPDEQKVDQYLALYPELPELYRLVFGKLVALLGQKVMAAGIPSWPTILAATPPKHAELLAAGDLVGAHNFLFELNAAKIHWEDICFRMGVQDAKNLGALLMQRAPTQE